MTGRCLALEPDRRVPGERAAKLDELLFRPTLFQLLRGIVAIDLRLGCDVEADREPALVELQHQARVLMLDRDVEELRAGAREVCPLEQGAQG